MYIVKVLIPLGTRWRSISKIIEKLFFDTVCKTPNYDDIYTFVVCLISSREQCQRPSPFRISDIPRAGFEPGRTKLCGSI